MKDYKDLIERARKHALPDPNDEREVMHAPLLRELADAIEALVKERDELAALRKQIDELEPVAYFDDDTIEITFNTIISGGDNWKPVYLLEGIKK